MNVPMKMRGEGAGRSKSAWSELGLGFGLRLGPVRQREAHYLAVREMGGVRGRRTIESSVKSTILRSPATVAERAEEARMSAKCERL